ncbi:hypothetical protein CL614_04705 [archaeon]|nr:hypothetical protein [archaeon]|tara:strand:- start:261 stop:800 length:540 start_codon:yes stop_codon:yes gene_type:complete
MAVDIFAQLVSDLSRIGFYDFLLPWLFTFAIVYGLLIKADLFGKVNTKVSGILAIVIAFFVSAYSGPLMASYFTTIFAEFSTVAAAILVVVMFAALVGFKIEWGDNKNIKYGTLAVLIGFGIVIFLIALGTSWMRWTFWSNSYVTAGFIIVLVLAAVAFVISGDSDSGSSSAPKAPTNK